MNLIDFEKYFPTGEFCKDYFRKIREKEGIVCTKCSCKEMYWDKYNEAWICKHCGHKTTLRSGTVMQHSKMPFKIWFFVEHLLTSTKSSFSVLEIQSQLGYKRYQTIWEMVHKLRDVMGQNNAKTLLKGGIELDEAFVSTDREESNEMGEQYKRGLGSERKSKITVLIESEEVSDKETKETDGKNAKKRKRYNHSKFCGKLRMERVENLKADTINQVVEKSVEKESTITMDASRSHAKVQEVVEKVEKQVVKPKDASKFLPWVHIAISNFKSRLRDAYHGVKEDYLQYYMDEFCYKFNRRYEKEKIFEMLMEITISCRTNFRHRVYNKNPSPTCG